MSPSIRPFVFEAIGTTWRIDFYELLAETFAEALLREIKARIELFDRTYSRFRPDSLITRMSQSVGTYEFPEDAPVLFSLYKKLYDLSDGLVTPLIGQVLIEAGYDASYSLVPKELHRPPTWEETLAFETPRTLRMKKPTMLDVGAMGKGYLIDLVGELLWQRGLRSFCVDAGGDILHRSEERTPLEVALEHPQDPTSAIGVATITNKSICGSAGNRRTWAGFHHVINPDTLRSPDHLLAVWTIAKTTLLADAMTTALFFLPGEQLLKHYDFEYLLLYPNQTVEATPGFPAELFLME